MPATYCIPDKDYKNYNAATIGQYAQDIGLLKKHSVAVLPSFVISKETINTFVEENHLNEKITEILTPLSILKQQDIKTASKKIQDFIIRASFPKQLAQDIIKTYNQASIPVVQILVSPTKEDLPTNQLELQFVIFSRVKGDANFLEALKHSWASYFTPEAISYRLRHKKEHELTSLVLLVEHIPEILTSGVMYTVDEIHRKNNAVNIEAVWGLPDDYLLGHQDPEFYQVEKHTWRIDQKIHHSQTYQRKTSSFGKRSRLWKKQDKPKLTETVLKNLAKIAHKVHTIHFYPQKMYWYYDSEKIYVGYPQKIELDTHLPQTKNFDTSKNVIALGESLSAGIYAGNVKVVRKESELQNVPDKTIVVTRNLDIFLKYGLKHTHAIICEHGGQASFVAGFARRLQIPVVQVKSEDFALIKSGDALTVDGNQGIVYSGKSANNQKGQQIVTINHFKETTSDLFIDVRNGDDLSYLTESIVDGGIVVESEQLVDFLNKSPQEIVSNQEFKKQVLSSLETIVRKSCESLGERPFLYTISGLSTYEHDTNRSDKSINGYDQLLGYSGAWKLIDYPNWLRMKLQLFNQVANEHSNLELVIPPVRNVKEIIIVKRMIFEGEIRTHKPLPFWVTIGTPLMASSIDEIAKTGTIGVILRLDYLSSLIQGLDYFVDSSRSYGTVESEYFQAILGTLTEQIKSTNLKCILYPGNVEIPDSMMETLMKSTQFTIIVKTDAIEKTHQRLLQIEHTIK